MVSDCLGCRLPIQLGDLPKKVRRRSVAMVLDLKRILQHVENALDQTSLL